MLLNKLSNKLLNLFPSVKGLGHKFGNLLLSPFTLATCAATSCMPWRSRLYLDVTKGVHCFVESHGPRLQPTNQKMEFQIIIIKFVHTVHISGPLDGTSYEQGVRSGQCSWVSASTLSGRRVIL